ncbi:MAG TPA: sigma-70 family RNA polymerase sigma factor [Mucilaginibacter sp.]
MKQQETHNTFIDLIKQYQPIIHKICYMYADTQANRADLYQEILVQVWRGFPKFRGDAKFSTWLYQVALNTAIAGLRKEKRSPVMYGSEDSLPEMVDTHPENAEQLELLYAAVNQLNDIEKALVMLYLDGKTYEEMENIMGIPNGALRVKMTRIKEKLRAITKNN